MQITTKYDMYQGLLNKMVGGHKRAGSSLSIGKPQTMNFSAYELQGVKYGDFSLRYTPSNLTFSEPNWDQIVTKREPTHPDGYYIDQIKELARKCFATGDMYEDESRAIYRGYVSSVSPDRKAIYDEVMAKTGGKMPASSMFWDHDGNKTLSYEYDYGTYSAIWNQTEIDRSKDLDAAYFDEIHRLYDKYGDSAAGHISLDKIHRDMQAEASPAIVPNVGATIDVSV